MEAAGMRRSPVTAAEGWVCRQLGFKQTGWAPRHPF